MRLTLILAVLAATASCKKEPPPRPPVVATKATPPSGGPAAVAAPRPRTEEPTLVAPKAPPPPAAGKGNIVGVATFNGKPAPDLDVKLCQTYTNTGCSGAVYLTKTDAGGSYLLRDIPPGIYQGLLIRLFERQTWMAAARNIRQAKPYTVVAGSTITADEAALFRYDLFLLSPRAGARVAGPKPTIRWAAYAGAARYNVTLSPEYPTGAPRDPKRPIFSQVSVDKPSFTPDKPLPAGRYRVSVEAIGSGTRSKIAESQDRVFIVADAADELPDPTPPPPYPPQPTFEPYKPPAELGAVQGVVLYNARGVPGIEVKLCAKFNRYFGGCSGGKVFKTKTDASGVFLIKDVPPATYEGLTARVFKTKLIVFVTVGYGSTKTYPVEAGHTLLVPPTHLFKNDVKVLFPTAKATVEPSFEVKWAPYPDAAYYQVSIHDDYSSKVRPKGSQYYYTSFAVDRPSLKLDLPLEPAAYKVSIVALNAYWEKLSDSKPVSFTVK